MRAIGPGIGVALAAAFSIGAAASGIADVSQAASLMRAAWTAGGFLAVTVPLGWALGRRFDRLQAHAERDALTGVCNRRFLWQCFPKLVTQADTRGKRFSLSLIDVNDFKKINDTLGHAKGDELLRKIAACLVDSAGRGEIVGRWGGDEFVLLCPYGDRQTIDHLHRTIAEKLARTSAGWNRPISVSFGAAIYPDDGRVLEELMQEADKRMYEDKRSSAVEPARRLQA